MVCLGVCTEALSQTAAEIELQLRRQQEREQQLREQQERTPDVRLPAPEAQPSAGLPSEAPCFVIEHLQLNTPSGAAVPEFDWVLAKLTSPESPAFLGQCMGAQGVSWLMSRAQKLLIDRGFVTSRVLVAPQDLRQGTLVLTLIPGRIRTIRLADPVDPHAYLGNALPMQAGDLLNLRDIEQALENLKRLPSAEADIHIEPSQGDGAQLGDSDVVVTWRQSFPLRLTVTADDSGTQATGKYQGSITVSYDNPLMLNDVFYLTHSNSLGGGDSAQRGTQANILHYALPLGDWALSATASSNAYVQSVAGQNQSYQYLGTSANNEIKLTRLLMRDSTQKLNLSVRAFQRKSNNFIDDTEVEVQRRVVGGWDSTLNHRAFIQSATLESNLTYRRGTGAFGAIPAPEEAFNEGTSRFALITADAQLALPFKVDTQRIRYNATWRIQQNQTPLTPQDRFAIGDRFTVRGFDGETVLSADRGWLWRNDLSFAVRDTGQELYVGLDHGEVSGPSSAALVGRCLTGAVLGLRGAIQKLRYDFFISAPVTKPDNFNTADSTAGFGLSATF